MIRAYDKAGDVIETNDACLFGVSAALLIVDHLWRGFAHFLFLCFAVFFEGRGLGHNRQGEIVTVAASVAGLEVIAVDRNNAAFEQVAKGAADGIS